MARSIILVLLLTPIPRPALGQEPFWQLSTGTAGRYFTDLALAPSNPDTIYAPAADALLLSTDGGVSWDSVAGGLCCGVIAVDGSDPTVMFLNETGVPFDGNAVWISTDHGSFWTELRHGFCVEKQGCAAPLLLHGPSGAPGLYASINPYFLLRTASRGEVWDTLNTPERNGLWSVAPSHQESAVMYAAYADTSTVFRSDDGGMTWDERPLPVAVETAVHLAVDPSDENTVYAALEEVGIYKTTNGGLTWEERNSGLTQDQLDIKTILVNPHQPLEIFAGLGDDDPFDGLSDLLVVSVDGGESWSSLSSGLPVSGHIPRLAVDPRSFRIFAVVVSPPDSFEQSGVYAAGIVTTASRGSTELPRSPRLYQNFPNPFNPATTITFDLPFRSQVLLMVHDILGRRVSVLAEGIQEAGRHSFRWRGDGMPSGVYFYTLTVGGRPITRTFTLMK
ncbi:MAG: T9SS type A sorting domain-containing protein [Ignavibacteria bacterium]|nr:T9SS type A sorting domain-containing protein [Ignavibacteria bacterium]